MALPHYKLRNTVQPEIVSEPFPFILVPADPPRRIERIKHFLLTRKWIYFFSTTAIAAAAALLWQALDPSAAATFKLTKNTSVMIPAAVLLGSFIFLSLIALLKNRSATPAPQLLEFNLPKATPLTLAKVLEMPSRPNGVIEWRCEQWDSIPFVEVLEETVISEIFPDEMVAPDHMVFSFEVAEQVRQK